MPKKTHAKKTHARPFPSARQGRVNSQQQTKILIASSLRSPAMRRFGTWALVRCSSRIGSVDQLLDDSHPPHLHSALQSAQLPVGKLAITACRSEERRVGKEGSGRW